MSPSPLADTFIHLGIGHVSAAGRVAMCPSWVGFIVVAQASRIGNVTPRPPVTAMFPAVTVRGEQFSKNPEGINVVKKGDHNGITMDPCGGEMGVHHLEKSGQQASCDTTAFATPLQRSSDHTRQKAAAISGAHSEDSGACNPSYFCCLTPNGYG